MKVLLFAFFATVLPAGAEAQVHKCRQPNGAYVGYPDLAVFEGSQLPGFQ